MPSRKWLPDMHNSMAISQMNWAKGKSARAKNHLII